MLSGGRSGFRRRLRGPWTYSRAWPYGKDEGMGRMLTVLAVVLLALCCSLLFSINREVFRIRKALEAGYEN